VLRDELTNLKLDGTIFWSSMYKKKKKKKRRRRRRKEKINLKLLFRVPQLAENVGAYGGRFDSVPCRRAAG
jgi:hypothetical protein